MFEPHGLIVILSAYSPKYLIRFLWDVLTLLWVSNVKDMLLRKPYANGSWNG